MLRFHAGSVDGPKGPEQVEHAGHHRPADQRVVAVVVQRQGGKRGAVAVGRGQAVVTGADGITDEFQLRQKPKEPPKRYANDPWGKGWG